MQLRKRLVCHYCAKKSNKSNLDNNRFQCEQCDSINIYDDNGEIVDVAPEENGSDTPRRFASGPDSFETNAIFCATCVKNQYLSTTALAEFLPDPEAPNYEAIEAALPKFKKQLEERFPQCCAGCEPRVRAQLEQATYHARSDHMRRMLERSRARRVASRFGWRSMLVTSAGIGYIASTAIQMTWHAMGFVGKDQSTVNTVNRTTDCLRKPIPPGCVDLVQPYVGWSLITALFCVWWNPKWQYKIGAPQGRLVGLGKYYQLQLVLLAVRFGAWICLVDFPPPQLYQEILHTLMFITITVLTGWAMFTIKVDTTPLVNWEYHQPQLVSEQQYVPPLPIVHPTFNIASLAPTTRPDLEPWQPPTPPSESDEMDWAPTQHFDLPKPPRFRNAGPTPFHGTLPALPGNPRKPETKQAIGLPPGHFDNRERLPTKQDAGSFMAEPKFFPRNTDTGLENIFDQVFSLHEPNSRPKATVSHNPPRHTFTSDTQITPHYPTTPSATPPSKLPLLLTALLTIFLTLWTTSSVLEPAILNLKLHILSIVSLLCIIRLIIPPPTAVPIRIFLLVELLVLAALAAQLTSKDRILDDLCTKLGVGVLAFLVLQEVYLYVYLQSTTHNTTSTNTDSNSQTHQSTYLQHHEDHENHINRPLNNGATHESPKTPQTRRRDSAESAASDISTFSTATTSTTAGPPGWQTPHGDRFDMRGLSMSDFGTGTGIASPRRNLRSRY